MMGLGVLLKIRFTKESWAQACEAMPPEQKKLIELFAFHNNFVCFDAGNSLTV